MLALPERIRFPNVPLLPPIVPLTALKVMLPPLPEAWVALLFSVLVTVIVFPPSFKVPEVSVSPVNVSVMFGKVALPAKVNVPDDLLTMFFHHSELPYIPYVPW